MKNLISGLVLFSTATSAQASMLVCTGHRILDKAHSTEQHEVTIDRRGFDQKPGIPVEVTIKRKLNSNTAKPAEWSTIVDKASGRMMGNVESAIDVDFKGGLLKAEVGNSGITGKRHALDGTFTLTKKKPVTISCPIPKTEDDKDSKDSEDEE